MVGGGGGGGGGVEGTRSYEGFGRGVSYENYGGGGGGGGKFREISHQKNLNETVQELEADRTF